MAQFSGNNPPDDDVLAGLSDDRPAAASTLPYFDDLNRLAALEQLLRSNGQWFSPHPWLTTFVGDEVESVVSGELATLTPADLGPLAKSCSRRSAARRSPARCCAAGGHLVYAFNLIRIPTTDDTAEVNRLVTANRPSTRVRAAGGTLYPVSAFPMSRDDWRRHFGAAWGRLRDAKQHFDPGHVLTPGYEVF